MRGIRPKWVVLAVRGVVAVESGCAARIEVRAQFCAATLDVDKGDF
jgi:hypothetical protein